MKKARPSHSPAREYRGVEETTGSKVFYNIIHFGQIFALLLNVYIVRTAYAKGFNKESSTLDELIEYYNESNPDVVSIQMRNYCEKKGKEKVLLFPPQIFG